MIPRVIQQKLGELRSRERLLTFVWGGGRWLAIVLGVLLLACVIDWAIDRQQETPARLRLTLSVLLGIVAVLGAFFFIVLPLTRQMTDDELSLSVQRKHPRLHDRLVSAVQLNREGANTDGMSPALIQTMTREAEQQAAALDFAAVADHQRLGLAAAVALPMLAIFIVPLLVWPGTFLALLSRQFMADVEIPRNVTIASDTKKVWPQGERVRIVVIAKGKDLNQQAAQVVTRGERQGAETFELEFVEERGPGEAAFAVDLPPTAGDFTFQAWIGDGRMKASEKVRVAPRPVVTDIQGWVLLPEFCGVRPDGRAYEQAQSRGDLAGIYGSSARVRAVTQKPVTKATLQVLGYSAAELRKSPEEIGPERVKRTLPMKLVEKGRAAEATFDLHDGDTAYRVLVEDEHTFENLPPPRRGIRLVPEEPPQVALLKETFPPGNAILSGAGLDDFEVEGMPVPPGGSIRIAYTAAGTYGLGQAKLLYRILKKVESGDDDPGEEKWIEQPLPESKGTEKTGPFIPNLGVFEKSGPKAQVFFHAVPSLDPDRMLPRTLGGGRFDFKTTGIPDGKGGNLNLKVGDQIEFQVKLYADKDGKSDRPWAISDTRVKTIVSVVEFARWMDDTLQEERRIRQLDARQRGLFEGK